MTNQNNTRGNIGSSDQLEAETIVADWKRYESPFLGIVETVAAIKGVEPTELEPIANYIDAEALNTVLTRGNEVTVSFEYADVSVTASSCGDVSVC